MVTYCEILRTNRTRGRKKVKDSKDDFKYEGGLYFIRREKVFIDKTSIRGKIRPTLLYIEGISDPLYLDNFKIKEYWENLPVIDEKTNKPIIEEIKTYDGRIEQKPRLEKRLIKKLEDIFIDARAIHNMTDRKILSVLSTDDDLTPKDIILIILCAVTLLFVILNIGVGLT